MRGAGRAPEGGRNNPTMGAICIRPEASIISRASAVRTMIGNSGFGLRSSRATAVRVAQGDGTMTEQT